MSCRTDRTRPRALLLAAALLAGLAVATGRAADAKKDTSLPLVPADAAFYNSSLRLKEQLDMFLGSKAYKALKALPTAKKLHAQLMEKLKEKNGPLEQYEKFAKGKGNKELMEVLAESVSDEVFFVGGKSWVDFLLLVQAFNSAQYFGQFNQLLGGANPQQAQARAILEALSKNKGLVKIPELVIGFRLKTPKKAAEQLDRLEKILNGLEVVIEQLKDRIEAKDGKDGKLLMLKLDAGLLPWDRVDLTDFEKNKGEFDAIIAHLKKMKLTVTLGVKGSNLLMSLGESSGLAENLGAEGKKLIDLPEMKPILDASEKKLTSIGYSSKAFIEAWLGTNTDWSEAAKEAKEALKAADLKDERKKALADDIDELVKDIKAATFKPGASVGYSFATDAGFEAYVHDHGSHDAAWKKVKTGLQGHFGGSPVFGASIAFNNLAGSHFRMFMKWARKIRGHVEGVVLDKVDAEQADAYRKTMKTVDPLLKRLEDTTDKQFLPSLKDGGIGLVLDGKWKSKCWVAMAPATPKEMPMAELGLLLGISDAKKFSAAMKEYRLTLNELYAAFREANPNKDNLPEFKLSAPESEKSGDADLYWWEIPEGPLDKQFRPTVGIGKDVAVVAFSKAHTERLLKATALKPRDPALAIKGDVIGCCVFDFVGLVDLAAPWIEHGIIAAAGGEDEEGAKKAKEHAREARKALQILKAFKGTTCTSYLDGDVLVSKTVFAVRDTEGAAEEP